MTSDLSLAQLEHSHDSILRTVFATSLHWLCGRTRLFLVVSYLECCHLVLGYRSSEEAYKSPNLTFTYCLERMSAQLHSLSQSSR